MNDTILIALISTSGTFLLGVVALITNYRLFRSLERRIELIELDIKEWHRIFSRLDADVARVKDRLDLK